MAGERARLGVAVRLSLVVLFRSLPGVGEALLLRLRLRLRMCLLRLFLFLLRCVFLLR